MKRFSQNIFELLQKYPGFIMMIQNKPNLPIDDKAAETLYNLWKNNLDRKMAGNSDSKNMSTLIEKGYLRRTREIIELTDKGKTLVLEMGLSSPNSFAQVPMPTYSDIKTKSAKRDRKTFVKKASTDIPAFNLKKVRNDSVNKQQGKPKGS